MKNPYIAVLSLSALSLSACESTPPPTNPPVTHKQTNPPSKNKGSIMPVWDSVEAPTQGDKAELIVTPSGCYKNFIPANETPKDRYEEKAVSAKSSFLIECPERAKDISKTTTERKEVEEPVITNPPPPG